MLTRAVAFLIATPVLAAFLATTAPAATAGQTWNSPVPAGCGSAGYPAGYGIWCPGVVHVVLPGESLWGLARAFLGNGHLWPEISVLGRSTPGPCGRPAEIFPGQILLIPLASTSPRPAPEGQPSCPPVKDHGTPSPSPSRSPSPGPATTPGSPVRGLGVSPRPRQHVSPVSLRLLPGVLTGFGVIAAISAAAIAARRRRRRQQPGPPPSSQPAPVILPFAPDPARQPSSQYAEQNEDLDEPYGPDIPNETRRGIPGPALALLTATPARTSRPAAPEAPPAVRATVPPGRVRLGVRDGREITADIAAAGGLGLTGPGASAAARAILGTLLSRTQPGPRVPVIVPADVPGLLPVTAPGQGDAAGIVPGLSRPASLTAALDNIEALILRRARLTQSPDAGDHTPDTAVAGQPTITLITVASHRDIHRLCSITADGQHHGVTVIVLGEWPYGITCHVAPDGMVTAATPADSGLDGTRLHLLSSEDLSAVTGNISTLPVTSTAAPAPRPPARPASRLVSPAAASRRTPPVPEVAHEPPPAPVPAALPAAGTNTGRENRPVEVSMLGPLRITAAGQEIGTGARKARELLAFLAIHGADGATGDAISEALWPGASPGHGKRQRNIALRKARDLLRSSAGRSGPMWIILAADRYRLDPALIDADLWKFQAALETARATATDGERLAAFRRAVSYYRGPLCDGAGYDWTEPYAETARHQALDAWTAIAGILQDTDPEQALAALEAALTHDPYNEYTYQQVMRLQAAAGRPAAVRRTYELLQARLAELGIPAPRESTQQAVAALLGESGPRSRPAGQHPVGTEKPRRPSPRKDQ